MTWDLVIGGVRLGSAALQDVILNPGSNIVPARCVLDLKLALKHLRQIIASEKAALKKGNLSISATGNTTVYNGQHIDYYEKNLRRLTLTAPLSIVSVLVDTLKGIMTSKLHSGSGLNGSSLSNRSSILPLLSGKTQLV
jgi:hypothetical protein